MEGRDIGTVVFPEARLKFFLDAALAVRGQRRAQEMQRGDNEVPSTHIVEAIAARDRQDQERVEAPLVQAVDAQRIDTTDLTVDEVVHAMLSEIHRVLDGERG
jgi:cytidylate kinase